MNAPPANIAKYSTYGDSDYFINSFKRSLQPQQSTMRPELLCLLILLLFCHSAESLKPKLKGLIPGSAGSFQQTGSEQIVAYYDLDRDGKVDILTKYVNSTTQLLNTYLWNSKLKQYLLSGSIPSHYVSLKTALITTFNVFDTPCLILYYSTPQLSSITIRPFICSDFQCQFKQPLSLPDLVSVDPIPPTIVNVNGSMVLLFQQKEDIMICDFSSATDYTITFFHDTVLNGYAIQTHTYASIYYGDFSGDCIADIILLTRSPTSNTVDTLAFIRGTPDNTYIYTNSVTFPQPIQHFTIQDINYDGKNELILLFASSKIQIHYNKYGSDKTLCNGVSQQVSPYDFTISSDVVTLIQQVQLNSPLHPSALLLFGDYNNDGFDDISLTFTGQNNQPNAQLYTNIPCFNQGCGTFNPLFIDQTSTMNARSFSPQSISGITKISIKLSFIDIAEDGSLDFMLNQQIIDAAGAKALILQPIYNNVDYDAFFLTITILAGNDAVNLLWNTAYAGGCVALYVTTLSGELAPKTANQLSQSGSTLQLPYIRMGLGRTNNYLQQVTISVPTPFAQFKWSPIIPNSHIVTISPISPSAPWTLKVMIQPTEKMAFVLILVIISLAVVGVAILRLTGKQKEEDKQTQESFYTLLR